MDLAGTTRSLYEIYKTGDFLGAERGVREALSKWKEDTDLLRLGALTALSVNQVVTAHQRLDVVLDCMPMTAELANVKGRIHKASGDWAEAERAYDLSEKLDPKNARCKINRLNLFLVSEQPKRVLEELEKGYNFGEMGEVARSQALTDLGRYEDAINVLESLDSADYKPQITFQYLKCFAALGRDDEMLDALSALSKDVSMHAKGLGVVVNYYKMRGQQTEALDILRESLNSNSVATALEASRLLDRLGDRTSAKIRLDELSKSHPDNAQILGQRASLARLAKRPQDSYNLYIRALTARPGDFNLLCGFAQAAISAGRLSEAQTAIEGALAQAPNNQFLLALVATLLRERGRSNTHLYDYRNFVRCYDIEAPNGYSNVQTFNSALALKLKALHVYKDEPVNQSLRSGTQTELDLSLIDDPVLKAFFKSMDGPIRDYMKHLGRNVGHPLRRRNTNAYRISGAWSVRLREKGHHVNHVHPMGWLSSAYYVDVPPSVGDSSKDGWIKFGEPNLDIDQKAEHFVRPVPGRLVLFPSYMWHGTVPFEGSAPRLTLPFDVVPA